MSRKILIIDDQEDMLLIMERELRKLDGLELITSNRFADALAFIASNEVDLVISDVRIGRDSGFDLAREVRRTYPNVGVILMSAYRSATNRAQATELGVLMFLEKPFQFPKLKEGIQTFFEQREQAAAEPEPPAVEESTDESGALAHFRLQDLVQLFCLNGKNVLITVAPGPKTQAGEIYIQRGRVIHADYAGKTGDEAFHLMMRIARPLLKVDDWAALVPVTISSGWEHLLLQSALEIDEQDAGEQMGRSAAGS